MTSRSFQVGDRVRLRSSTLHIRAGAVGTIRLVYSTIADTYEVKFDGYAYTWLMHGRDLEQVRDEPEETP
jgi:hypothetical protein